MSLKVRGSTAVVSIEKPQKNNVDPRDSKWVYTLVQLYCSLPEAYLNVRRPLNVTFFTFVGHSLVIRILLGSDPASCGKVRFLTWRRFKLLYTYSYVARSSNNLKTTGSDWLLQNYSCLQLIHLTIHAAQYEF